MEKTQWYMGTPNGVVLCIDSVENERRGGRLYHGYAREALSFSTIDEAIFHLEGIYDALNFPHPTTNSRTFAEQERPAEIRQERMRIMKDEELLSRHGDLGTFIIRVQHRQNSSWQGRITWMEKNKTVYFRSIWEMIKLVAGALDTVSTQEESPKEPSWEGDAE